MAVSIPEVGSFFLFIINDFVILNNFLDLLLVCINDFGTDEIRIIIAIKILIYSLKSCNKLEFYFRV